MKEGDGKGLIEVGRKVRGWGWGKEVTSIESYIVDLLLNYNFCLYLVYVCN